MRNKQKKWLTVTVPTRTSASPSCTEKVYAEGKNLGLLSLMSVTIMLTVVEADCREEKQKQKALKITAVFTITRHKKGFNMQILATESGQAWWTHLPLVEWRYPGQSRPGSRTQWFPGPIYRCWLCPHCNEKIECQFNICKPAEF